MDGHKCDYVLCCNYTGSCGCDMCNREVVSVYWVSPFLMGNYLMIIRNNRLCAGGMDAAVGIISCIIVMVVSVVLGSVYFNKKNIL